MNRCGAVIAAAGKSSRMGSFKPLLPLRDSTIIEEIISTLRLAGVEEIIVVIGREAERMVQLLSGYNLRLIHNSDFERTDMFHSVKMGLSAVGDSTEKVFFLPVDVPLCTADTLKILGAESDADIIIPEHNGKTGHPVLIKKAALPTILSFRGEGGLKGAIEAHCGRVVNLDVPDFGILPDADYENDYRLIRLLAETRLPDRVARHSRAVADLALLIAGRLNEMGCELDLNVIELAALLHDMAKGTPGHARRAGETLSEIGQQRLAEIVSRHNRLSQEEAGVISEVSVVYLADKLIDEDCLVPLNERFGAKLRRYGENPEAMVTIRRELETAVRVKELFETRLGAVLDLARGVENAF